ncbi:ANTAR domain-containing response regulator [Oscillibacter sp.]|uniref:ANTAR domain-containing response regulator n=1 Tax=Oscillibacter sp. TaxID=1945593 RepID=UPI00260C0216|nr:ANTAR domain-containing protein [Oscillibacter sp.]MDD3347278.1 ANTAR domain-containing protein [Oscillibacter sp.]
MDRIVVAFSNEEAQRRILHLLENGGYAPALCCCSGAEAIRAVRKLGSATVVCGFKLRDMTAENLAADLRGTAVLLVISSAVNLDLCEGENLYKLSTPVLRADFFATMDLLRQLEEKSLHHPPPKRRDEEQLVVQRAKELLMDVHRMTEGEAHRFLQKRSMNAGWKMAETAQFILDSYTH